MSLKAFHVFFVAIALLLCLTVGAWGIRQYQTAGDYGLLYIGVGSFAAGLVLGVYGLWFLRKLRNVSYI